MVLLSGKRKIKPDTMYQSIPIPSYPSYSKEYSVNTQETFYGEFSKTNVIKTPDNGDLTYQIKTKINLLPEYEIYHLIFGETKEYTDIFLTTIKECLAKKMSYPQIKSIFK